MNFRLFVEELERDKIVPKGSIFYHGTLESFDVRKPRPGGYDEVFWTTEDMIIARSYIPRAGGYSMTSADYIARNEDESKILKKLGMTPKLRAKMWEIANRGYQEYKKWDDEYRRINDIWNQHEKAKDYHTLPDEFFDRWKEAEAKRKSAMEDWKSYDQILKAWVIRKMAQHGYKADKQGFFDKVFSDYEGNLRPADYRAKGRVLEVVCMRDFKFFDFAKGREGDLMEPDYHKIGLFRKLEDNGYDGIIINDFAQTEYYGNYGHESYGFFGHAVKDLKIKKMHRDQTHPTDADWIKDREEWEKQYKAKSGIN